MIVPQVCFNERLLPTDRCRDAGLALVHGGQVAQAPAASPCPSPLTHASTTLSTPTPRDCARIRSPRADWLHQVTNVNIIPAGLLSYPSLAGSRMPLVAKMSSTT
ncbi:hypothetical protein FQR65_LT01104 [Abscondita terminalis]|nr:hypothetical protein FQR65_LT01104 [Abscondita terminalis]